MNYSIHETKHFGDTAKLPWVFQIPEHYMDNGKEYYLHICVVT